jgi:hypothetical protein
MNTLKHGPNFATIAAPFCERILFSDRTDEKSDDIQINNNGDPVYSCRIRFGEQVASHGHEGSSL